MGCYKIPCCVCGRTEPPIETDCTCCGAEGGSIPPTLLVEIPDDFLNLCADPCERDEFGNIIDPLCRECTTPCNNGAGAFALQQAHPNDIAAEVTCATTFGTERCDFHGTTCENAVWYYPFPDPTEDCEWCVLIAALEWVDETTCALVVELMGPDRGEVDGSRNGILWRQEFSSPVDCVVFLRAGVTVELFDDDIGCTSIFPPCCGYGGAPITVRAA